MAMAAANQMTTVSLYMSCRNAPIAGLVTKLAANVAEAWAKEIQRKAINQKLKLRTFQLLQYEELSSLN